MLKLKNVFFKYPYQKNWILYDISLTIQDNEFIVIFGPSGGGKTTLIQLFNGLYLPNLGKVFYDDKEVNIKDKKLLFELKRKVSIVFQYPEHQIFEDTVRDELLFGLFNYKYSKKKALKRIKEVIYSLGLNYKDIHKLSPFNLSGGQKRLIALASVLALQPEVLILDEPTVGLDSFIKEKVLDVIFDFYKEGRTVIFVTHYLSDVLDFADRFIYLKAGKIFFDIYRKDVFKKEVLSEFSRYSFQMNIIMKLLENGISVDNSFKINDLSKYLKLYLNC